MQEIGLQGKRMNILFIFIAIVTCQIFVVSAFAQQNIKGLVTDIHSVPLDYFTVEILNIVDSSVVKGGTFVNGEFAIDNLINGKYFLKLSSLGYLPLVAEIDTESLKKFSFQLKQNEIHLDEIVVTARMPKVVNKEDRFIVEVENSSLSDAGNAIDALRRTPFVIIDRLNGEITVAGKGNSIIFINNRKITNQEELIMLNSQNIKQIEVIENPSAKYEAEGHSVINIITRKNQETGINVNLQTNYTRGRHNSEKFLSNLTYVTNNIILFSQYNYNHINSEGFNFSNERFEKEDYSFHIEKNDLKNLYKTGMNSYSLGINYNPSSNHSLGLKYDGYSRKVIGNTIRQIDANRNSVIIPTEIMSENGISKSQNNGINFNYNFANKGYEFSIIGDYISSKKKSFTALNETDIYNTYNMDKNNIWDAKYDLFSAQIDTRLPIVSVNSSLEIGARASYVESENDNKFENLVNGLHIKDDRFSSIISFDEMIIGSYFLLSGKINDKTQYRAGLRYEYTANNNKWISTESSIEQMRNNNLFPSLLLSHKFNDKLSVRLSYSKRITRPSYETLNNRVLYINSYSVNQGNPFLRSAIYNTLSLSSQFKKLNFSINLSHIKNPNDLLYLNDSVQIEKYTVKRINTEDRWSVAFNVNYSYTYRRWTIQPFFQYDFQRALYN
jgi:hypothetical protein